MLSIKKCSQYQNCCFAKKLRFIVSLCTVEPKSGQSCVYFIGLLRPSGLKVEALATTGSDELLFQPAFIIHTKGGRGRVGGEEGLIRRVISKLVKQIKRIK